MSPRRLSSISNCTAVLDQRFRNRYIRKTGPIRRLVGSPDLTLLDFYVCNYMAEVI